MTPLLPPYPQRGEGKGNGILLFRDHRSFQKFLHPKTIREKILLKVVLLSFQSSFLQYFILKVSIWKRILLNVIVEGRAAKSKG